MVVTRRPEVWEECMKFGWLAPTAIWAKHLRFRALFPGCCKVFPATQGALLLIGNKDWQMHAGDDQEHDRDACPATARSWFSVKFNLQNQGNSVIYLSCVAAAMASAGGSSSQPISKTRSAGPVASSPWGVPCCGGCRASTCPSGWPSSSLLFIHSPARQMHTVLGEHLHFGAWTSYTGRDCSAIIADIARNYRVSPSYAHTDTSA